MRKSGSELHSEDVDAIVGEIYEGVTTPRVWTEVFERLGRLLAANSALLIARDVGSLDVPDRRPPRDEVLAEWGVNPMREPGWSTFRRLEPAARFVPKTTPGKMVTPEDP